MSQKQILIIAFLVAFLGLGAFLGSFSRKSVGPETMNKSRDNKPAATDEDKVAFTPEVPAGAELSKPIIETPAGLSDGDEKIRIFEMKISRAGYVPNNFTINAGDTIQIRMTALDNDYDFYLPWHGIYQNILRGEMKLISFTPKEGGTLAFECRDKCPGGKITGSIVVLP